MMRLDALLVQQGLAASRQRAQELIRAGQVQADGVVCTKASRQLDETAVLCITGAVLPYVGRGGLKLAHALECYPVTLTGSTCMDIGASTGGFTDCMLQNGAQKVYAVDVGHDQLAEKLRKDPRVLSMEGTDVRTLELSERMDFISVDVSFISLRCILPKVAELLKEGAAAVLLIKPQFEAGREQIGKHGLVKSPKVHQRVLEQQLQAFAAQGLSLQMLCPSPIRGGTGNIEYLAAVRKTNEAAATVSVPEVVTAAFSKK